MSPDIRSELSSLDTPIPPRTEGPLSSDVLPWGGGRGGMGHQLGTL